MGKARRIKQRRKRARAQAAERARTEAQWKALVSPYNLRRLRTQILNAGFGRDSCIYSTRVICEMAKRCGFEARPLTCTLVVMNPVFGNWIREHGWNLGAATAEELGAAGGRLVVVGDPLDPAEEGRWAGHLVALVRRPRDHWHLIDMSIDQVDRPGKRIVVRNPLVVRIRNEGFLRGDRVACSIREDGVAFEYSARPGDQTFRDALDWTREVSVNTEIE